MSEVISQDGTAIAFERQGSGPPMILVDGALCYRGSSPNDSLAEELAPHYTVFTYDRRGRGQSRDTHPYSHEREVEDLNALVAEAGGSAHVYGISSGAALRSRRPSMVLPSRDWRCSKRRLWSMMHLMPAWRKLKRVSHTLPYDAALLKANGSGRSLAPEQWASIAAPTLVVAGGKSPAWTRTAMKELAEALPRAEHRVLEGQMHIVKAKALAPMLLEFFAPAKAAAQ